MHEHHEVVMNDTLLLTVDRAARRLGMSRGAIYPLVLSGDIPSIKIGRARRIPIAQLEAWVARQVSEQVPDVGPEQSIEGIG